MQRHGAVVWGAATGLAAITLIYATGWYDDVRQRSFDALTNYVTLIPEAAQPIVVDIDSATLTKQETHQLKREFLQRIISRIAEDEPQLVVVDVLMEGEDTGSASYLARSLAKLVKNDAVTGLANELPSDEAQLVKSARRIPLVLGLALAPEPQAQPFPVAPIVARGRIDASKWWTAPGVHGPLLALSEAAAGLGILALPGDADGAVRRLPLFAVGASRAIPGLALEAVRIQQGASTYLISADDHTIAVGNRILPLMADGMLRLVESPPNRWLKRTIPAHAILQSAPTGQLKGQTVLVGSSAPELGGLRTAAGGELAPSVQLHADAVAQINAGIYPTRSEAVLTYEAISAMVVAATATALALLLPPVAGASLVAVAGCLWVGASLAIFRASGVLIDPLAGPLVSISAFTATALAVAAHTRLRAASLQRRFEQHLAPAVVKRILDDPDSLKLGGERREVTSLFTDLEGFTSMTERAEPEALVALLDKYFENVSSIVIAHGGMIDKFVGDAVHALFNAPLDMPDHTLAAFNCALEIDAFSRSFQSDKLAQTLGLGRTRIGLERGLAIVGDVGGKAKLDYTAHGTVINTAARLEAANKQLGSSICVGPEAAICLEQKLRPLGLIELRGRALPQMTYTYWPDEYTADDQASYIAAFALKGGTAADEFAKLAEKFPSDTVVRHLADAARLSASNPAERHLLPLE